MPDSSLFDLPKAWSVCRSYLRPDPVRRDGAQGRGTVVDQKMNGGISVDLLGTCS